jgi:hypothetical protein
MRGRVPVIWPPALCHASQEKQPVVKNLSQIASKCALHVKILNLARVSRPLTRKSPAIGFF